MQFGLFMMPLHPPYRSYADSYDRDLALLVEADRLGFHEAWIGEHLTERWENAPCPDLLIAKASAMTQHIKLATGITLLPIHNPVELAQQFPLRPVCPIRVMSKRVSTCLAGPFDEPVCRFCSPTCTRRDARPASMPHLAALEIQLRPDRRLSTVWIGASGWSERAGY